GGVQLAAGELERLEDRQHLLDAGDGGQRLALELVLVADDADDGALLAAAEVRLEAQLLDVFQDVLDLFRCRVGSGDDNPCVDSGTPTRSVSEGFANPSLTLRVGKTGAYHTGAGAMGNEPRTVTLSQYSLSAFSALATLGSSRWPSQSTKKM